MCAAGEYQFAREGNASRVFGFRCAQAAHTRIREGLAVDRERSQTGIVCNGPCEKDGLIFGLIG